jgi:hypothetical protein
VVCLLLILRNPICDSDVSLLSRCPSREGERDPPGDDVFIALHSIIRNIHFEGDKKEDRNGAHPLEYEDTR